MLRDVNFAWRIHPKAQSDISEQQWVTGFQCVWGVVGWLILYQDGNYLYPGQCSQTIRGSQIGWYRLRGENILMARPSTFLESRSCRGPVEVMTVDLFLSDATLVPRRSCHYRSCFYPIVILVPSYHPQVLYDLAPTEWPTSITFQSPRRGMKEIFL